jgi:putative DNA primase/helicase
VRNVADDGERRPFDPAIDTPLLALALSRLPTPPAMLIVDPIVSAVAGDSHKNSETRRSLQPLVDLGERIGCAILGISHFSKGTSGRDPVERVTGSLAFGALARAVMAAVKTRAQDGTPGPRLFARAKSNLGPDGGGFHYSLEQVALPDSPGVYASRVLWGDPVEGEASALLAAAEADTDADERAVLADAESWLVATLAEAGGSMDRREIMGAAKRAHFPERTVYRARDKSGVQARTAGFGTSKRSVWTLRDCAPPPDANSANPPNVANSANPESLATMARMEPSGRIGEAEGEGEVF